MPSGVSHGSAPPSGSAPAVLSNAIFAKSGMRLIGPIIAHAALGGRVSIMVRMLVADDVLELIPTIVLQGSLARQVGDADHPAKSGLTAELLRRHHPVRAVEGAGHDLDLRTFDAAEAERRAALGAKVALGDGGRAERGGLAAGPGEVPAIDFGERRKRRARCLLAHPAMTNADPRRGRRHGEANGAALAAAGQNGLSLRGHAH